MDAQQLQKEYELTMAKYQRLMAEWLQILDEEARLKRKYNEAEVNAGEEAEYDPNSFEPIESDEMNKIQEEYVATTEEKEALLKEIIGVNDTLVRLIDQLKMTMPFESTSSSTEENNATSNPDNTISSPDNATSSSDKLRILNEYQEKLIQNRSELVGELMALSEGEDNSHMVVVARSYSYMFWLFMAFLCIYITFFSTTMLSSAIYICVGVGLIILFVQIYLHY